MTASSLSKIDQQLSQLDPKDIRHQVLVSLRRFRSSWIDLARLLTEVAYGGDYKEWGHDSFENYCSKELGLKKPTVNKLLVSYRYMQRKEPERLAQHEEWDGDGAPPEMPDYRTVELLQKTSESDDLGETDKGRFHRLAFEDGVEEGDLRKEIRGALNASRDTEIPEEKARERELDDLRRTAKVLRRKLADSRHVPQGLKERFESLLAELEAFE